MVCGTLKNRLLWICLEELGSLASDGQLEELDGLASDGHGAIFHLDATIQRPTENHRLPPLDATDCNGLFPIAASRPLGAHFATVAALATTLGEASLAARKGLSSGISVPQPVKETLEGGILSPSKKTLVHSVKAVRDVLRQIETKAGIIRACAGGGSESWGLASDSAQLADALSQRISQDALERLKEDSVHGVDHQSVPSEALTNAEHNVRPEEVSPVPSEKVSSVPSGTPPHTVDHDRTEEVVAHGSFFSHLTTSGESSRPGFRLKLPTPSEAAASEAPAICVNCSEGIGSSSSPSAVPHSDDNEGMTARLREVLKAMGQDVPEGQGVSKQTLLPLICSRAHELAVRAGVPTAQAPSRTKASLEVAGEPTSKTPSASQARDQAPPLAGPGKLTVNLTRSSPCFLALSNHRERTSSQNLLLTFFFACNGRARNSEPRTPPFGLSLRQP